MKVASILILICAPALAQHEHHNDQSSVSAFLMRQASGSGTNPAAAPMPMSMTELRGWMVMLHGNAFVSGIEQSGPRGAGALTSTNWLMGMAERSVGPGHLMLRSMISVEPLLMGRRGYPELFQTGETAYGRPLIDRQHPHELVMELAAEYAADLGNSTVGYVYAAPVGEPALGPVGYPHRASATELPQAPLSHHVQDSTHIANSVLTAGAKRGGLDLAISGFHGQEPDENRWDIDHGRMDSWSVRAQWDLSPNLVAQLSTGHLTRPERLEPGNIQRTTASVTHSTGALSTSVILGQNHKSGHDDNSLLVESNLRFNVSNDLTGRFEMVDKEAPIAGRIKALTLGYTKDILRSKNLLGGVGGNVTLYGVPAALRAEYGERPVGVTVFARIRLGEGS